MRTKRKCKFTIIVVKIPRNKDTKHNRYAGNNYKYEDGVISKAIEANKISKEESEDNIIGYIQEDHGGTNQSHKKETLTISCQHHMDKTYWEKCHLYR